MILIQLLVFAAFVLCLAGAVFAFVTGRIPAGIAAIVGAIVFGIGIVFSMTFVQVDAGYVGVLKVGGQIQPGTLSPGIHNVWPPFLTTVEEVDTRVKQVRLENFAAASQEQQNLFLTITLNYHVDPAQAQNIIQNIGLDYEAKIISPRLQSIPKQITQQYATTAVLGARGEIQDKATQLLSATLLPFGIVVDGIAIENFDYSPEYNAAIEQKQVAQQQVEVEKQNRDKATIAAETAVENAKGQANAQIETAKGDAQAAIERARGEAQANGLISQSLTDKILEQQYITKLAPGLQTVIVPEGSNFLWNPQSLLPQAQPPK